jgi:hypothetical protein
MSKRVKLGGLSILAVAFLYFNTGCKKPEIAATKPGIHKLNGTLSIIPAVENGMLTFATQADFDEYQQQLLEAAVSLMNSPDDNGETPTFDEALNQLEDNIPNFISLRAKNVNQFELENINGWDNEDDIPEKHKLVDPLLESSLNEYGAVTIGNEIIMYLNKDLTATIGKSEVAIYGLLIEMPESVKGNGYTAAKWVGNINTLAKINFEIPSLSGLVIGSINGGNVTLGQNFSYNINPKIEINPCNTMQVTLNRFSVIRNPNNIAVLVSGIFTVNWGDGTSENGYIAAGGSQSSINHTYANPGTYHPTLIASVTGSDGQAEVLPYNFNSLEIYGGLKCNAKTLKDKNQKKYSSNGQAYINCRILFRSTKMANNIQAETEFYQKNSNGKWKNVKTGSGKEIYARVWGGISFSNKCSDMNDKDLSESKTNKSSVTALERYGMSNPIYMQQMNSYHHAYYGNEKIELTLDLPNCQ